MNVLEKRFYTSVSATSNIYEMCKVNACVGHRRISSEIVVVKLSLKKII